MVVASFVRGVVLLAVGGQSSDERAEAGERRQAQQKGKASNTREEKEGRGRRHALQRLGDRQGRRRACAWGEEGGKEEGERIQEHQITLHTARGTQNDTHKTHSHTTRIRTPAKYSVCSTLQRKCEQLSGVRRESTDSAAEAGFVCSAPYHGGPL